MAHRNRLLVINPKAQPGAGDLEHILPRIDSRLFMCSIALPTLAALTPESWDVVLCDEGLQPLGEALERGPFDVIGVTSDVLQLPCALDLLERLRIEAHSLVVLCGTAAGTARPMLRELVDVLLVGEAERTWPAFLRDFETGTWKREYVEQAPVDPREVPAPRVDLLPQDGYLAGAIQTSGSACADEGTCGATPRSSPNRCRKTPDQVVLELENWYRHGYRLVFLIDDDFFGEPGHAARTLSAIREWRNTKPVGERMELVTDAPLSLAADLPLVKLALEAGLLEVSIAIGRPHPIADEGIALSGSDPAASALDAVHELQRNGIVVSARLRQVPDEADLDRFKLQLEFLQHAGIPLVKFDPQHGRMGTSLEPGVNELGALAPGASQASTSSSEGGVLERQGWEGLVRGRRWLFEQLYNPENFLTRLETLLDNLPAEASTHVFPAQWQLSAMSAPHLSYRDAEPIAQRIRETIIRGTARFPSRSVTFSRLLLQFRDARIILDESGTQAPAHMGHSGVEAHNAA